MRSFWWGVIFVLFVGMPGLTSAASVDPSLRWKTIETKHFAIHFYEGEEEVARRLAVVAEEVYGRLSEKFDARPWGKTEVVVVDNHDIANGFTTVLPYNLVVLRVVPPTADATLADYDDWLRELFTHEYTHVIHITDTRYPAKLLKFLFGKLVAPNGLSPGWVLEGIATYLETSETTRGRGRASFTDMLLRTDILQGRFLHLDQMAGTGFEWPAWLAQYLYGVGFWQFLAERYGEEKVGEFSHKYGASLRFFQLNSHAKRVFGKNFYKLWAEWKADLEGRYAEVRQRLEGEGVREGDGFLQPKKGESFSLPTLSPDGKRLVYLATSIHHPQELRLRDLEGGEERVLLKKRDAQQISFSPDGEKIVLSGVGTHKKYYQFADLHEVTIATGKVKQLTQGKRARDPDYSPDGKKIVAVLQETGRAKLGVYDVESEKWSTMDVFDQPRSGVEGEAPSGFARGGGDASPSYDHPRWLSDGRAIVVSVHEGGQRDLWIIDGRGKRIKKITKDVALDDRPVVDRRANAVYFSSDRTGIPNIYRYDLKRGKTYQVTNVLTGAFSPTVTPDGTVVFQYYNGRGFEIRRVGAAPRGRPDVVGAGLKPAPTGGNHTGVPLQNADSDFNVKKYNPFKKLFIPRYILPNAVLLDNAVFLSATVSNFDPLYRHQWYGDVTFRSDNKFVGFGAGYTYNRFLAPVFVGFSDFTVNYGDVFGLGNDFFEERKRGFAGISIPLSPHRLSAHYFFEDRSHHSGLPAGTVLTTLGRYAGFFLQYAYHKTGGTAARISPEEGEWLTVNFEMTDRFLGASEALEQKVVWGDARKYIRMPYADHHVLALRAAGGVAFGDQLLQGNFGLGGSIGEGLFTGTSTRVFTLRGLPLVTFSRDRAWVASAEYRLPLFRLQRGLGTLPFALNSAHFALFADIGDAFNRGNPSFRPLLGVGTELRGDFIVGWHLPISGRLGYGIILTNRGRIAGVTDSLTGADARNGVVILELGTAF